MYCRFRKLFGFPAVYAQDVTSLPGTMVMRTPGRSDVFVSEAEIQQVLANETGRDRLNQMFAKDESGRWSPEFELVYSATENTAFAGLVLGTLVGSRMALEKFKSVNKETVFETKFLASRAYMDTVFIGGAKAGFAWAVKLGLFAFMLIGSSQMISVYRNKSDPLELVGGGAITGGLLRINLGIKGMVAGGLIGSVLGLMAGTVVYASRRIMNETQEQRHYWDIHKRLEKQKRLKMTGEDLLKLDEVNAQGS